MQREELTKVILRLLAAWGDPLSNLHDITAHWQDFNTYSGSKALDMTDMVHQLRSGVQRVAERVRALFTQFFSNLVYGDARNHFGNLLKLLVMSHSYKERLNTCIALSVFWSVCVAYVRHTLSIFLSSSFTLFPLLLRCSSWAWSVTLWAVCPPQRCWTPPLLRNLSSVTMTCSTVSVETQIRCTAISGS